MGHKLTAPQAMAGQGWVHPAGALGGEQDKALNPPSEGLGGGGRGHPAKGSTPWTHSWAGGAARGGGCLCRSTQRIHEILTNQLHLPPAAGTQPGAGASAMPAATLCLSFPQLGRTWPCYNPHPDLLTPSQTPASAEKPENISPGSSLSIILGSSCASVCGWAAASSAGPAKKCAKAGFSPPRTGQSCAFRAVVRVGDRISELGEKGLINKRGAKAGKGRVGSADGSRDRSPSRGLFLAAAGRWGGHGRERGSLAIPALPDRVVLNEGQRRSGAFHPRHPGTGCCEHRRPTAAMRKGTSPHRWPPRPSTTVRSCRAAAAADGGSGRRSLANTRVP